MLRICDALYSKAAVVVFQSEYQRSCFSASAARHSRVIPNPVAVNAAPAPREVNRIVTVGRLSEQKNQKMLIEAAHILKDTFPDLTFELYGAGKNHDELAQMIAALDLAGSVKLMGNRENVHQCINSAAMFVLTSRYEGVSNALLEAMMLGLPCICTEFPGVDEVIRDGCNGLLVPQNDAQALADAIQKLLENKELCDELSKNAIDSVQRFRADRVMTEWEDAIVQLQ